MLCSIQLYIILYFNSVKPIIKLLLEIGPINLQFVFFHTNQ